MAWLIEAALHINIQKKFDKFVLSNFFCIFVKNNSN